MTSKKPTNVYFNEEFKSFAFEVEILYRKRQCFISLEAAEFLFGKQGTGADFARAIAGHAPLVDTVNAIAATGEPDPILLSLAAVRSAHTRDC